MRTSQKISLSEHCRFCQKNAAPEHWDTEEKLTGIIALLPIWCYTMVYRSVLALKYSKWRMGNMGSHISPITLTYISTSSIVMQDVRLLWRIVLSGWTYRFLACSQAGVLWTRIAWIRAMHESEQAVYEDVGSKGKFGEDGGNWCF